MSNDAFFDHAWVRDLLGLGDAPPPVPEHDELGEVVVDGVVVRRMVLHGDGRGQIPALVLTPDGGAGGPRVLAIHQHNDEYHWGKSEVAGLRGNPDMAYALELAQRGCTVLAPDVRGFEERGSGESDANRAEHRLAWDLVARGSSLAAEHVADLRVSLSWLAGQASSSSALGVVGHSLGGQLALFLTAADERVDAAVSSCGVATLASFADVPGLLHNPSWYVPGLRRAGDAPALAKALADQRILVSYGTADPLFPAAGVQEVVEAFRAGVATERPHEGGHEFPGPERAAALDWLVEQISVSA